MNAVGRNGDAAGLAPAHQRLGADQTACGQFDLGLEIQAKRTVAERLAQVGVERLLRAPARLHVGRKHFEHVADPPRGGGLRHAGVAQQRIDVCAGNRRRGRAEQGADDQRSVLQAVRRGDPLDDLRAGRRQRRGLDGAQRQERETCAIEPRDLDEPEIGEPLRHHRQQPVADAVAEHVVDEIETPQRQAMHRYLRRALGETPPQPPEKLAAREDAGDFVMLGHIVEPREMSAALGDVAERQTGDAALERIGDLRHRHRIFKMTRRAVAAGKLRLADVLDATGRRQRRADRLRQSPAAGRRRTYCAGCD